MNAIKKFKKAIELNKENVDAWFNLGECWRMVGRYKFAIDCYWVINGHDTTNNDGLDSSYIDAWINEGFLLLKIEMFKQALECFETAINIEPNNKFALKGKEEALKEIKNLKYCSKCNAQIKKNERFCLKCGSSVV
ncbi:MAG: tetratricopeptide repeat protein [Candidatus Thorarchaeota archaeon]